MENGPTGLLGQAVQPLAELPQSQGQGHVIILHQNTEEEPVPEVLRSNCPAVYKVARVSMHGSRLA